MAPELSRSRAAIPLKTRANGSRARILEIDVTNEVRFSESGLRRRRRRSGFAQDPRVAQARARG
jgi:hypothetical protein